MHRVVDTILITSIALAFVSVIINSDWYRSDERRACYTQVVRDIAVDYYILPKERHEHGE